MKCLRCLNCFQMYLEDEEFKEVFGMTKEKFLEKPQWKRIEMRKAQGLF